MKVNDFFSCLKTSNFTTFYGVPDSLLKNLCAYITDNVHPKQNIITANEGNAIAMACGHYLATSNPAVVYMQNSGLGNCVNPLLSLADEDVYNIPFLIIIGWRGQPNIKDEPQHVKQGKITDKLLDTMGIKYSILPRNCDEAKEVIIEAKKYMNSTNKPYALLIEKDTFDSYSLQNKVVNSASLSREQAISIVADELTSKDIVVATTGHISRELYEYRDAKKQAHKSDFLCVGSMGHASSIAIGIAIAKSDRNVFCFDGDGAFLMQMGAVAINGTLSLNNLKHIVFNNAAHDSVGGQPTCCDKIEIPQIAQACGYKRVFVAYNEEELTHILSDFFSYVGTALLEIKVKCGARVDLGRPKETPIQNKENFMKFLQG